MIRLDIIADFACPWCYLGKAMLDRALEARPDHPFRVEWHPYELSPEMPKEGMDRHLYLSAKFGDLDGILRAHRPLVELAEKAGVALNLPAIARTPNSFDAHRLAHWAALEGRQSPVVAAIYRGMWRDGRDIGDPGTLADIAAEAGMDRALTERLLASDADAEAIRARIDHARARGVTSVPTYIVADRHVLRGAQQPDLWTQVIDEIRGGPAATAGDPDAE